MTKLAKTRPTPEEREETAADLMTTVAAEPSLDELMARIEGETTREQRLALIRRTRDERASWRQR